MANDAASCPVVWFRPARRSCFGTGRKGAIACGFVSTRQEARAEEHATAMNRSALLGLREVLKSADSTMQRNGAREKLLTTGVADVTMRIPETCTGSFFAALLARRRIDVALHTVIMQATARENGDR